MHIDTPQHFVIQEGKDSEDALIQNTYASFSKSRRYRIPCVYDQNKRRSTKKVLV
jgi:hypothetical protein